MTFGTKKPLSDYMLGAETKKIVKKQATFFNQVLIIKAVENWCIKCPIS